MRPRTACLRCRELKRRCLIRNNESRCHRCKSMRIECRLVDEDISPLSEANRVSEDPLHSLKQSLYTYRDASEDVFPEQSVCDELVDLYFDLLHDKQHALFHRPSFIADQRIGRAPAMLVAAMMALSARFSTNVFFEGIDPLVRGRIWADHARRLFFFRSEAVSLVAVQACCILGSISFVEGDMANESLFGAQAIRMVQLLNLPNKLSSNWVQRETEIRVWWTIWMMDNWSSAGAKLTKQLVVSSSYPHPMEESSYEKLDRDAIFFDDFQAIEEVIRNRFQGLWAQMIPLTEIMSQIVQLNENTVHNRLSQAEVLENVEKLGNKLDSWLFRLPREMQITPDNLERYLELGHGRTLVALHLGFHHHAQVLYYQFLHPQHADSVAEKIERVKFAGRCKEHALELSNLLRLANSTQGCECLWAVTGHLLVISSSVQLHTLLFGDDDVQIENAKMILKHNFEMILNLRRYWPSLDLSMSRLRAFHRACQESMHTSFAMDQWMLLFLQRYMQPVSDRVQPAFIDESFDLSHWPTPVRGFGSETDQGGDTVWGSWSGIELPESGAELLQTFL